MTNRRLLLALGMAFLVTSIMMFFFALALEQSAMTFAQRGEAHPGAGGVYGVALLCGVLAGLCGGGALKTSSPAEATTSL